MKTKKAACQHVCKVVVFDGHSLPRRNKCYSDTVRRSIVHQRCGINMRVISCLRLCFCRGQLTILMWS